jgi:hypothetical protein
VKSRAISLASAAAALFIAGAAGDALAQSEKSEAKIKCEGVNECKGKSACSTANNSCAGKNSCKGKGFEMMTAEECQAAKQEQSKQ